MTLHRTAFAFLLASSAPICRAQDPVAIPADHATVQRLRQHARDITSLQASFTQEKVFHFMTGALIASGTMDFQRPDRMRWQVDGTDGMILLLDGASVRVMRQGAEQDLSTTDRRMYASITDLMRGIINGELLDSRSVEAHYFLRGEELLVELSVIDKRMAERIEQVSMVFRTGDLALDQLRIIEADGDSTTWTFRDARFNSVIPATTFTRF